MSRYRPPQPKSSPYITEAGHRSLDEELRQTWVRRRDIVVHLSAAAAEGDRSENAEYIYRKKQLRELDRRLRYLQKRLPELKVVAGPPPCAEKVYFGALVTVCDAEGHEHVLQIVGADEIDPAGNRISIDAPMARALLGRAAGDEITVKTPGGEAWYSVAAVRYSEGGL